MQALDDMELVREYVQQDSQAAFSRLVERHVALVYSVALRQTGHADAAADITQAVFILLARKAGSLKPGTILPGWLLQAARLTASSYRRTEMRRASREQEVFMEAQTHEAGTEAWPQIRPLLDDALGHLGEKDRNALALRFFEGREFAEVGLALGTSEDAAKMRVSRALDKLRKFFARRGVVSSATAIAGAISAQGVQAAPAGLAASVAKVAAAGGAAAGTSTLALVHAAVHRLAWMKFKMALLPGAAVLLAASLAVMAYAPGSGQKTPGDLVAFFKQAISSPFEVDSYVAGQRSLQPQEILAELKANLAANSNTVTIGDPGEMRYCTGASAGTNFFKAMLVNGDSAQAQIDHSFVVGRGGDICYEFGLNSISYGVGSNSFVTGTDMQLISVRQDLDMGLGDVNPASVVWSGNEFGALNERGLAYYGELVVSNNRPFILNVRQEKGGPIFKAIEYSYPDPPDRLGGFPAKMTLYSPAYNLAGHSNGSLKPSNEIVLKSVHLATRHLPVEFFNPDRFKTAAIRYTNIYRDAEIFIPGKNQTMFPISYKDGKPVIQGKPVALPTIIPSWPE